MEQEITAPNMILMMGLCPAGRLGALTVPSPVHSQRWADVRHYSLPYACGTGSASDMAKNCARTICQFVTVGIVRGGGTRELAGAADADWRAAFAVTIAAAATAVRIRINPCGC